jgi:hypothetical protein
LTAAEKVAYVDLAQCILQAPAEHKYRHFYLVFTGDEPWMFYIDDHRTT